MNTNPYSRLCEHWNARRSIITLALPMVLTAGATTVTTIDATGLQAVFDSLAGHPRIILILDPQCGGCIATAGDFRNDVFAQCANPDLRGLVVWVPTPWFGSALADAQYQADQWTDSRVLHYWDPGEELPYAFGDASWTTCSYAWDFAVVYEGSTIWSGTEPPVPLHCMSKTGCCSAYSVSTFLFHMNTAGLCSSIGVPSIPSSGGSILFVNAAGNGPASLYCNIDGTTAITICDPGGRIVAEVPVRNGEGEVPLGRELSTGIYLVTARSEHQILLRKKVFLPAD